MQTVRYILPLGANILHFPVLRFAFTLSYMVQLRSEFYFWCVGWGGSGLGALQQGIEEPIKAGEVRDKIDKYKA